jgi:hypothetical protein
MSDAHNKPNGAQHSANEIFALADKDKVERAKVIARTSAALAPPKRDRTVLVCLIVAFPILIGVFAVNVYGLSVTSLFETPPSPSAARHEAQQTLTTLVADVEEFWKDNNELPESLVEIGVPARGQWTYSVRPGNIYQLRGTLYGQSVSFDAPQPRERELFREQDQD